MPLRPTWRDVSALLLAAGATLASIGLWGDGRVAIGLELDEDLGAIGQSVEIDSMELLESELLPEEHALPGVYVASVTPDGNAARHRVYPGSRVIALTTTDGGPVAGISEVTLPGSGHTVPILNEFGEPVSIPTEAAAPGRISGIVIGDVYLEPATSDDPQRFIAYGYETLERRWLESTLATDVYGVGLGILIGFVVALLSWRGWFGDAGRRVAIVAGTAVALPLLLIGVVEVGDVLGVYAVYVALIASSLLLAIGLAERLSARSGRQAAMAISLGAAGVAAALIVRHMLTPELSPDERGPIALLLAAIAFAPAVVVAMREPGTARNRAGVLTLGAFPGIGALAIMPSDVQPALPPIAVTGVLLIYGLPWERAAERVAAGFARVRSGAASVGPIGGREMRERRDPLVLTLVGLALFAALTQGGSWAIALAGATGMLLWLGVRQGVLGPAWTDAATPLAGSVAVPILLAATPWGYSSGHPVIVVPTALAGLAVAHLLAERHSDPPIGARLFLVAVGFALLLVAASLLRTEISLPLVGLIPLIPAIPVAFAERAEGSAVSWPLETLAVALTPMVATTVIGASGGGVLILGSWLAALVVWRYFALNPLIGLARRTELQRDVAVAAAETERARLAADLHDDALQQLTMLVRTLDEGGQKEAADEAREIATKLRSVVGDLRLPILDDLGAGAALEWLVERVEPLAGGAVKLERSDETRPPANVELAVFRVAQEALTNAIKHGRPPIAVRYDVRADGRVTLAIDDAGEGIGSGAAEEAPKEGHFGLVNMQQRAEQIGALLDVRRWPAGGTRVALEWRPVGT